MSTYKAMAMEQARYNKWQNEVLYGICDGLSEDELKRDRGAFFASILGTLNHILHVDRVLLDFIVEGQPPEDFDPAVAPHDSYADLKAARARLDREIEDLMDTSPPSWFDEMLEFYSTDLRRERRRPRALMISQLFNHQTHHRAQATALLHQMGLDYGSTDMPHNPYSQS